MQLPEIALSVRQPWAWAIIHAGKDIENRSAAAVRHGMTPGRICIHASKGMTQDEYDLDGDFIKRTSGLELPRPDDLVRGAIIGFVTVTEIITESESPWFFGPRGLVLIDAVAVDPIPASGQLGYFKWERGGDIDTPKPWMTAWPETLRRQAKAKREQPEPEPAPMPLFQ